MALTNKLWSNQSGTRDVKGLSGAPNDIHWKTFYCFSMRREERLKHEMCCDEVKIMNVSPPPAKETWLTQLSIVPITDVY